MRGIAEADIEKLTSINNKDLQTSMAKPGVADLPPSFAGFDKSGGIAIGERLAWRHQLSLGSRTDAHLARRPRHGDGHGAAHPDFPVVAIFKIGMSEYDEGIVYLPLADAQELFRLGRGRHRP